ncbi:hypothetical protein DM02DRAFT_732595 [Periconia macrospinosa]|uniref:Uncharacterized protein n=1 Tax=Periconia macrospinosa TaxID=97972 RepID=A0A2V1D8A4_9PLEO|nr:hypothetical protein DM02DRAFT_732595 [Periconia macrospinosa]
MEVQGPAFAATKSHKEEMDFLRRLCEMKADAAFTLRRARWTEEDQQRVAKIIEQITTGSQRKQRSHDHPLPQRTQDRLETLTQLYTQRQTELRDATHAWLAAANKLEQHLTHVVKPSSLALCEAMFARLPRELRDQIYTLVIVLSWKEHKSTDESFKRQYANWPEEVALDLPLHMVNLPPYYRTAPSHLWDEEFVGPRVRSEMVEVFYRTAQFRIGVAYEQTTPEIDNLLVDDVWDTGIKPFDFISKIVVGSSWRHHLKHQVTKFNKNTQVAVVLEMSRYVNTFRGPSPDKMNAYLNELQRMGREAYFSGYRVRIFMDKYRIDLDEDIDVSLVEKWILTAKQRTEFPHYMSYGQLDYWIHNSFIRI